MNRTTVRLFVFVVVLVFGCSSYAQALCAEQDMAGTWYDPYGAVKKLEIGFPCDDMHGIAAGQPPPEPGPVALVTAWGPCDKPLGICSWGEVPITDFLVSYNGSPQTSRLDAVFDDGSDKRSLVILKISPSKLLVYMSVEFPEGSDEQNFSTVQFLDENESCRYWRGTLVCPHPRVDEYLIRETFQAP